MTLMLSIAGAFGLVAMLAVSLTVIFLKIANYVLAQHWAW